jgi:hypothetical protein
MKLFLTTSLFAATFLTLAAPAAVVLTVDLSTPNQITVAATTGQSLVTASGSDTIGIYLEGLVGTAFASTGDSLTGPDNFSNFLNSPSGTSNLYRLGTDPGLNVFSFSTASTVNFTAGVQAFQGSATWNVAPAFYSLVLANGASAGNVYFPADEITDLPGAQIIGTYSVISIIPEPGKALLLVPGIAFLALSRRRRHA